MREWFVILDDGITSVYQPIVHFGTGALTLDLEPGRGLIDAIDNPSRIDGLFIERAMVRASDKLSLLSAEAPIHQPVMTDGSAFFQLEEELRGAFEMTIVDIPRQVLIPFPHLVAEAGTIMLVSDVTLAAARDTIRLLSWFKQNVPGARVVLVGAVVPVHRCEFLRSQVFNNEQVSGVQTTYPVNATTGAATGTLPNNSFALIPTGGFEQRKFQLGFKLFF